MFQETGGKYEEVSQKIGSLGTSNENLALFEQKFRELENQLKKVKQNENQKLIQISEKFEKIEQNLSQNVKNRQKNNQQQQQSIQEVKFQVQSELTQETQNLKQRENQVKKEFNDRVNKMVEDVNVEQENREQKVENFLNQINDNISELRGQVLAERKNREESYDELIQRLGNQIVLVNNQILQERKQREDQHNDFKAVLDSIYNNLMNKVEEENQMRRQNQNLLLKLLEETCQKVERHLSQQIILIIMSNFKNHQWRSQSVSKQISQNNFTPVKAQLFQHNRINSNSVKQQLIQNDILQSSQRNSYQNIYTNSNNQNIYQEGTNRQSRFFNSDQIARRSNSTPKQYYQSFQNENVIRPQNLNQVLFKTSFQEYNFGTQNQPVNLQRTSITNNQIQRPQSYTKIIRNSSRRDSFSSNNSISIQEYNKIREKTPEVRLIKATEKKVDLDRYMKRDDSKVREKFNQVIQILNQKAKDQIKRQFGQMQTLQRQILFMEYIIEKYQFFLEQKNVNNIQTPIKKNIQKDILQNVNIDKKEQQKEEIKQKKKDDTIMSSVYIDEQSPNNKKKVQESQDESFQSARQQQSNTLQSFHESIQSEIILENSNLRKQQTEALTNTQKKQLNSAFSDTNIINLNNKTSNIFLKKNQNNLNRVLSPKKLQKSQSHKNQKADFQQKYVQILQNQKINTNNSQDLQQQQKNGKKDKVPLQEYQIIVDKKDNLDIEVDDIHSEQTEEIPLFSEDGVIEERYEEEEEDERQAQKMQQQLRLLQQTPSDHKRTFSFNENDIVPRNNSENKQKLLENHYQQIQKQSNLFQKKNDIEKEEIDKALKETNNDLEALLQEEKALAQERKNLALLREQITKQKQEMLRIKQPKEKLDFDKIYDPKFVSNTSSQLRHLSDSRPQNETLISHPTTSRYKIQSQSIQKTLKNHINYSYESRLLLTPNESISRARQTNHSNYRDSTSKTKFFESIVVNKQPWSERYMNFNSQKMIKEDEQFQSLPENKAEMSEIYKNYKISNNYQFIQLILPIVIVHCSKFHLKYHHFLTILYHHYLNQLQ